MISATIGLDTVLMKKGLLIFIAVLVSLVVVLILFRGPIRGAVESYLTRDMFVVEDQDAFDPGLAVGQPLPELQIISAGQKFTDLRSFQRESGLVLVAVRSVDWCPYCMRQVIDLQQHQQAFADAGVGLVVMSYDSPDLQQAFIQQQGITIPLVADIDAYSIKALGILNPEPEPDDPAYGIPYPGVFILNPQQQIVGKLFLEPYRLRISADAILAFAQRSLLQ